MSWSLKAVKGLKAIFPRLRPPIQILPFLNQVYGCRLVESILLTT